MHRGPRIPALGKPGEGSRVGGKRSTTFHAGQAKLETYKDHQFQMAHHPANPLASQHPRLQFASERPHPSLLVSQLRGPRSCPAQRLEYTFEANSGCRFSYKLLVLINQTLTRSSAGANTRSTALLRSMCNPQHKCTWTNIYKTCEVPDAAKNHPRVECVWIEDLVN